MGQFKIQLQPKNTQKHKTFKKPLKTMFDLVPFGVFEGKMYRPRNQALNLFTESSPMFQLDNFGDFNSFLSNSMVPSEDKSTSRTISIPNVKPENVKINIDKTSKTVTITANETNQSSNNGCEYLSSSNCSYKFQLPEKVIFESLKTELEGANLTMKWELDEEDDKNNEENKKRTIPIEIINE